MKTEYDLQYEYIAHGAIIRSRARWYEQGEKSNKYFFNSESSRGEKSTIRKIVREDKSLTTNPKVIIDKLKGFYSNLYQATSSPGSESLADSFLENVSVLKLSKVQKGKCEASLTVSECFNTLKVSKK